MLNLEELFNWVKDEMNPTPGPDNVKEPDDPKLSAKDSKPDNPVPKLSQHEPSNEGALLKLDDILKQEKPPIRDLFEAINHKIESYEPNKQTLENHLIDIVCIQWCLQLIAEKQENTIITRGSFKIIDPEHKLFNYLNSYAKKYTRISSHYEGEIEGKQFGINIEVEEKKQRKVLPYDRYHILFAKLKDLEGQNLMFVKFETAGLDWRNPIECTKHLMNWAKHRFTGKAHSTPKEDKSVKAGLVKILPIVGVDSPLTSNPIRSFRETAIDSDVEKQYRNIIELMKEDYEEPKKVREMYSKVKNFEKDVPDSLKQGINKFYEIYKEKYPNDDKTVGNTDKKFSSFRTGGEVIIYREQEQITRL